jgi:hypothetical protein
MTWAAWLQTWGMDGLKIKMGFLEMDWHPKPHDREAAWEMYVELLTRITVQPLTDQEGDETAALESIYKLFGLTREIIKANGRKCGQFSKIAIVVLNQVIRPFTAKWHRRSIQGAFRDPKHCKEFRQQLEALQVKLRVYTSMLADMAGVEDLTNMQA